MKYYISFLLFILSTSIITFAQNSFAPIGAQWYADFNSESHTGYSVYTVIKDTIIENIEARLIEAKHYKSDGLEIFDSISSQEIVYELEDTVFYYNCISESFLPLYYFNVAEESILQFRESDAPNNIFEVKVDSITDLVTNGISLEVVYTSAMQNWGIGSPESLPYAQTIGSLSVVGFSTLHVQEPQLGTYFPPKLRCYIDQDINYQIDGLQNCEQLLPISIEEHLPSYSNIKIYPNPTLGQIHVVIPEKVRDTQIKLRVLDLKGRALTIIPELKNQTVDLGYLEPGIYLIEVLSNDERVGMQKLIKQ